MNKALAVCLLVICNLAAVFGMSVLALLLIFLFGSITVGITIGTAAIIALGFASSRIFKVFKRKYGLKPSRYILASYIPPVIGAAVYWIVFLSLDASGYFKGWFAGMGELLLGLSLAPAAVIYLISGAVWSANAK